MTVAELIHALAAHTNWGDQAIVVVDDMHLRILDTHSYAPDSGELHLILGPPLQWVLDNILEHQN